MAQAIYVFGHQNPDTDSICASLSYAYLKQALGNENVVACRLGNINKEQNMYWIILMWSRLS